MKNDKDTLSMKGMKILIVDDNARIRDLIKLILNRHADVTVLEAEDGRQCLTMVSKERPDMIIMDHHMPHLDGLSASMALRKEEHSFFNPIVLMSGDHYRVKKAGQWSVEHFLPKPFTPAQLLETSIQAVQGSINN